MSINMKCPHCAGEVYYDPEFGKMRCLFCGEVISKEEFAKYDVEADEEFGQQEQVEKESQDDYMELNIFRCSSCGAELMINGTEASTYCAFCGSHTIVFERVSKELRPRKIIPFKISEAEALDFIKKRFELGDYVPKELRKLKVEQIRGIYIPFWLCDSYIRTKMTVEVVDTEDDRVQKHFYYRDAGGEYNNIPYDASLDLPNYLSQRLEPYHMEELENFELSYLAGYYADKYDVPKEAVLTKMEERCRNNLYREIIASCPNAYFGNSERKISEETYELKKCEYALLPAYFVNVKTTKGNQMIIVNGQTGKVVGDVFTDKEQLIQVGAFRTIMYSIILSALCLSVAKILHNFEKHYTEMLVMWHMCVGLLAWSVEYLTKSIRNYKKYKKDKYRITTSNIDSYVNDREVGVWH